MNIDLTKLKELATVNSSEIKSEVNEFSNSEIVAQITYYGGLKVTVLKTSQNFIITYKLNKSTWTSCCININDVIKDVEKYLKVLQNSKVIPS